MNNAIPVPFARALSPNSAVSNVGAGEAAFEPPLSNLPHDIQAAVRRSNDTNRPDVVQLYPFVAKHEGPLPAKDVSTRFGGANADATRIMQALHARMKPFQIAEHSGHQKRLSGNRIPGHFL